MRKLTKSDLVAFFDRFISPSSPTRTKLSVLMRSQRFQPSALDPFLAVVREVAPSRVDDAVKLVADKPTLAQLEAFVGGLTASSAGKLEAELQRLKALPPLPEGTREVEADGVDEFRRGLERAEAYKPVKEDEVHGPARL